MNARVLIMAGGTGGHVYPALAVAEQLRGMGAEVVWLGTRRGLESRVVPANAIRIFYIAISGLRGKGMLSWLMAPFKLGWALSQSLVVMLRHRPAAVLGMGGFVTGPGGLAAWLLRKPLLIHEQNAVAGLTNRLLARLAGHVMEAFPQSFPDGVDTVVIGNPVRHAITQLPPPDERFAARVGPARLLVLGGSQGARALNEVLPQALAQVPRRWRPEVWHQTGAGHLDAAAMAYRDANIAARVVPYIDDMAAAYEWADLVVCRAGALTIAELTAAGVGAVLVPYPYAVDDHQTRNAHWLVDCGGALLVPQTTLTPSALGRLICELVSDRDRLLTMARAARARARPDADRRVADLCLEVAR